MGALLELRTVLHLPCGTFTYHASVIKNVKVGKGGALSSPIVISVIINEIRILKKRTLHARRKVFFDVDVKVGVPAARSCKASASILWNVGRANHVISN